MTENDCSTAPASLQTFAWFFLLASACYQLALAFASPYYVSGFVTFDDTYLYLAIARNWAELGFPTFDGNNPTSGFQPLWNVILTLMASLISDRETLLRTACAACALLNVLTGPLILWLGKELATPKVAYTSMIGWSLFLFCQHTPNGMESSLHGVIFALAALVALPTWNHHKKASFRRWLLLGGLLALVGLCRLDSGIISAEVAALFAWRLMKDRNWRGLCALACLPVIILSIYMGWNRFYFGSFQPISGRVKMYWAYSAPDQSFWDAANLTIMGTIRTFCHSIMYVSGGGEYYSYPWLPILLVVLTWTLVSCWRRKILDRRLVIWALLMLVHTLIVYLMLQHLGKSFWYYQPLRILASLTIGHVICLKLPGISSLVMGCVRASLIGLVCVLGVWKGLLLYSQNQQDWNPENFTPAMRARTMGEWIRTTDQLPGDARIGSWNAGQIGYLAAPRQVINLDGLVQTNDFLKETIIPKAWKQYLRDNNIHYLVDYNYQDSTQTFAQNWDREQVYRNLVPWDEAKVVKQIGPLYLIDIRTWLAK